MSYSPRETWALLFTGRTESPFLEAIAMSLLLMWFTRHVLSTRVLASTKTLTTLSILARLMTSAPFPRPTTVSSPPKARSHKGQVSALAEFMFYPENICIQCISICLYVIRVECNTTGWPKMQNILLLSQGGQILIANAHHITWDPYRNCCTFWSTL